MARYACVPGVSTEAVGHLWAVFSPASGETLLLNDESASILEVLAAGACDTAGVCAALSAAWTRPPSSTSSTAAGPA